MTGLTWGAKHLPDNTAINGTAKLEAGNRNNTSHGVANDVHPSYDGNEDGESTGSVSTSFSEENVAQELVTGTGHGLAMTGGAIVKGRVSSILCLNGRIHY